MNFKKNGSKTHLRLALRYSVDVYGEGERVWRGEEEEGLHEAEEADAAQVRRGVRPLEPDPLPVGTVSEEAQRNFGLD